MLGVSQKSNKGSNINRSLSKQPLCQFWLKGRGSINIIATETISLEKTSYTYTIAKSKLMLLVQMGYLGTDKADEMLASQDSNQLQFYHPIYSVEMA